MAWDLRRLWPLLRQILLVGSIGLPPALAYALKRFLGAQSQRVIVPEVPFSTLWQDATFGRLAEVHFADNYADARLRPWASGANSAGLTAAGGRVVRYRTRLLSLLDGGALIDLLARHGTSFGVKEPHWGRHLIPALLTLLPVAYLGLIASIIRRSQGLGKEDDGVGKKVVRGGEMISSVSFADIAGADEAKAELSELASFLRDDSPLYAAIGARLPRGVLLSGPSGTGKTLLARAVAAEAGVPFFSCSASDFVEMLVGRGAARVRDLFRRGEAAQPSIIFIDELDALAKVRGGINSNDEREQTLNQLLTEMDGFDSDGRSVVVVAATNRPEVLDPALTRPGRFDRHVTVALPDTSGRRSILEVHCGKVRMASGVRLEEIARATSGFSGAELANVVNEAAMLAVRSSETEVGANHLRMAVARARAYREVYNVDNSGIFSSAMGGPPED